MAITRPDLAWRGISPMQFFLVQDEDQLWSWQLKSGADIVAVSPATYASVEAVRRAVEQVKKGIDAAQLPNEE